MGGSGRSYGGKSAVERAAERRERLVAATIDVLADHGAAQATMTAVCAGAGLTERYFYESFASIEDAMVAALDTVADEIIQLVLSTLGATSGTPDVRVNAMVAAFVDLVAASPAKARVAVIESAANSRLRARRRQLLEMFADLVAQEAANLYGEAAWPPARARLHGLVYAAGLAELVAAWLTGDVPMSDDDLIEVAGSLFTSFGRRAD